jgi:D-3-phosphoglycerate dehydrogenase
VLAHILNAIRTAEINVQEMENIVFEGAEAAIARIHLDKAPPREVLERLPAENENIMQITLVALKESRQ